MIEPQILIATIYYSTIGFFVAVALEIFLLFWHLICYNLKKCGLIPSKFFIKIAIIPFAFFVVLLGIQHYAKGQLIDATINALSDEHVVVKINGEVSSNAVIQDIIHAFEGRFDSKVKGSHPINAIDIHISLNGDDIFYTLGRDSQNEDYYWVTACSMNIESQLGYIKLSTKIE